MKKKVEFPRRPGSNERSADEWVKDDRGTDREGRGEAEKPPPERMKRLTIDVTESLHSRIKVACARRGNKIADELRALLETHFPPDSEGPRR